MAKREVLDKAYMACAFAIAELSQARRKKVGAIIIALNGGIIAEGFNGTPYGFDNNCEDAEYIPHEATFLEQAKYWLCHKCGKGSDIKENLLQTYCQEKLTTKTECVHAEANAIAKVACSTNSSRGGTMYCTLTPCLECAKLIIQARIIRVVYAEQYPYAGHAGASRPLGLELLKKANIEVHQCG